MLSRIGSELHLPDYLLFTVNGEPVGYHVPYSHVPESVMRTKLARYPKMMETTRVGHPAQLTFNAEPYRVEVLFYYDHADLRVTRM